MNPALENETDPIAKAPPDFSGAESTDPSWKIVMTEDNIFGTSPDGQTAVGADAIGAALVDYCSKDNSSCENEELVIFNQKDVSAAPGISKKWDIGDYIVRISAETHDIWACFEKAKVPHIGIMISRRYVAKPIIDLHLAAWWDRGRLHMGIYNSGSHWQTCFDKYTPSWNDLKSFFRDYFVKARIDYRTAEWITIILLFFITWYVWSITGAVFA